VRKTHTSLIKIVLRIPSTLHNTVTLACLGLPKAQTGLCNVSIKHQVQYVEPQDHFPHIIISITVQL